MVRLVGAQNLSLCPLYLHFRLFQPLQAHDSPKMAALDPGLKELPRRDQPGLTGIRVQRL